MSGAPTRHEGARAVQRPSMRFVPVKTEKQQANGIAVRTRMSSAPARLESLSTRLIFFAGVGMAAWLHSCRVAKVRVGIDEGVLGLLLPCLGIWLDRVGGRKPMGPPRLRRLTLRIGFPAVKNRDARASPAYFVKAKCARKTVATRTGTETEMTPLTRRSVLRCSLAFGAAGTLARPYIIQHGMAPQAAAEKALKRVSEIFAKYPIA